MTLVNTLLTMSVALVVNFPGQPQKNEQEEAAESGTVVTAFLRDLDKKRLARRDEEVLRLKAEVKRLESREEQRLARSKAPTKNTNPPTD